MASTNKRRRRLLQILQRMELLLVKTPRGAASFSISYSDVLLTAMLWTVDESFLSKTKQGKRHDMIVACKGHVASCYFIAVLRGAAERARNPVARNRRLHSQVTAKDALKRSIMEATKAEPERKRKERLAAGENVRFVGRSNATPSTSTTGEQEPEAEEEEEGWGKLLGMETVPHETAPHDEQGTSTSSRGSSVSYNIVSRHSSSTEHGETRPTKDKRKHRRHRRRREREGRETAHYVTATLEGVGQPTKAMMPAQWENVKGGTVLPPPLTTSELEGLAHNPAMRRILEQQLVADLHRQMGDNPAVSRMLEVQLNNDVAATQLSHLAHDPDVRRLLEAQMHRDLQVSGAVPPPIDAATVLNLLPPTLKPPPPAPPRAPPNLLAALAPQPLLQPTPPMLLPQGNGLGQYGLAGNGGLGGLGMLGMDLSGLGLPPMYPPEALGLQPPHVGGLMAPPPLGFAMPAPQQHHAHHHHRHHHHHHRQEDLVPPAPGTAIQPVTPIRRDAGLVEDLAKMVRQRVSPPKLDAGFETGEEDDLLDELVPDDRPPSPSTQLFAWNRKFRKGAVMDDV